MAGPGEWPDAEAVLRDLLSPLARTVTKIDENQEFVEPLFAVRRIGGADDGITDRPRVEVTAFAGERHEAQNLAEAGRQRILAHSGKRVMGSHRPAGTLIDKAATDTGPREIPDRNPDLRKVPTVYRLAFRRYSA